MYYHPSYPKSCSDCAELRKKPKGRWAQRGECRTSCYLEQFEGYPMRMMRLWGGCHTTWEKDGATQYSVNLDAIKTRIDWGHPLTEMEAPHEIEEAMCIIAGELSQGTMGGDDAQ